MIFDVFMYFLDAIDSLVKMAKYYRLWLSIVHVIDG